MKITLFFSILLFFSATLCAQNPAIVYKVKGSNALVEPLVVPSGGSVTINSGGSIINNGTATGFGSGAVWGAITGTLSNQTDLNTALNAVVTTARGGFGASVASSTGVPLFSSGTITFTGTSGTGNFVRVTSPTLVTPTLGVAIATSVNGLDITTTTGTFTLTNAKTLSVINTLTLSGTDGSTLNIGTGGTLGTGAYAAAFNPATPGAIGGTTPAAGTFTGLTINTSGGGSGTVEVNNQGLLTFAGNGILVTNQSGSFRFGFTGANDSILTAAAGSLSLNQKLIIIPQNNTSALVLTGGSITGSGTTPFVSITGTANTAGDLDYISADFVRTADGNNSRIINLKFGGISYFSVGDAFGTTQLYLHGFPVAAYAGGTYYYGGNNVNYASSTGVFAVSGSVQPVVTDSGTNTVVSSLTQTHTTSNAQYTVGFGLSMPFVVKDATTNVQVARMTARLSSATHGSESSSFALTIANAGAELDALIVTPNLVSFQNSTGEGFYVGDGGFFSNNADQLIAGFDSNTFVYRYASSNLTFDGTLWTIIGNIIASGGNTSLGTLTVANPIVGSIAGVTDGSDAATGTVGEFVSSKIASGAATSLTTATGKNITSINLTAGDWDVDGNVNFSATTATVTGTSGGINTTSNTVPTDGTEVYSGVQVTLLSETDSVVLPRKRMSLNASATIYLVGKCTFSAGSVSAFGSISARRVR